LDFDLESPGLDILLTADEKKTEENTSPGIVDFLDARMAGRKLDVEQIIVPLELSGDYKGRLFLVSAGRCDADYLAALDRLDLRQMYERSGLLNPVRALRVELEQTLDPDVVLVDSRTGYSDTALVTLFDLADAAVVVMVPDLQNVLRLEPVLLRLLEAPRKPQIVLVANKCQLSTPAMRSVADIEDRLRDMLPGVREADEDEEERPFLHKLPFESTFTWAQRLLPPPPLSDARQKLGERIHRMVEAKNQPAAVPSKAPPPPAFESSTEVRARLLAHLDFGKDAAEGDESLLDTFVFSAKVIEALRPERWLVRGRKGAGLTSVFRMLTEQPEKSAKYCPELTNFRVVAVHGAPFTGRRSLDFRTVVDSYRIYSWRWKDFWRMYAVGQAVHAFPKLFTTELQHAAKQIIAAHPSEVRDQLGSLLKKVPSRQWIEELHSLVEHAGSGLLFVYEDFAASFRDNTRERRDAITELLEAWGEDIDPARPRLLPKILLRDDAFTTLPNVQRFRTRDMELRWDFDELAELVVRRARKNSDVAAYLTEQVKKLEHVPIEARQFVALFDERVHPKGKYARTWLAVKNRLADIRGDLFPRDFVRLGNEALSREKQGRDASRSFEPALIAGLHTLEALKRVSEQRVRDLTDELPEDEASLLKGFSGLRSPFDEKALLDRFIALQSHDLSPEEKEKRSSWGLKLLKQRGIVGEWTDGRLFVPDLYLHGLGMYRAGW